MQAALVSPPVMLDLVPRIHVLLSSGCEEGVDPRDKAEHDASEMQSVETLP